MAGGMSANAFACTGGVTMNVKTYGRGLRLFRVALALLTVITFTSVAGAQNEENVGRVQQGLVDGAAVSPAVQEQYALLTLGARCSASLLRNNWVITAAHCVDRPNPERPGQFITAAEDSVTLTARWPSPQVRQSVRIITFRPNDVAIIRVATPFVMNRSSGAYNREVFRDGELASMSIIVFGRGISRFAQGSGPSATPSWGDGSFRIGLFTIDNVDGNLYGFTSTSQSVAGGDSGGPSFATINGGNRVLVGVHSQCDLECVEGQICGNWPGPGPAPAGYSNWRWVRATPSCADALIAPVWDDISGCLGAFVPAGPDIVTSRDKLGTTPEVYAGPGAPVIKGGGTTTLQGGAGPRASSINPVVGATQHDALAAKGEALVSQDPLFIELRNRQPEGPARRGFDIGIAAAEGQTLLGPGKQRIHDSLTTAEQSGFRIAVGFSLERNRNAERAAKGAAIAESDPTVAAARTADPDFFYWLGFDIATAIFGDPALGAQGNTQTGPGSLGLRDSLSPAGQRGFNAAVSFHLARNYKP